MYTLETPGKLVSAKKIGKEPSEDFRSEMGYCQ